jgi:hypothetical protein
MNLRQLAVVVGTVTALSASRVAVAAEAVCTVPAGDNDVVIDLLGNENKGKLCFRTRDSVRIIVKNLDPFLYDYSIGTTETPVEEPALSEFFKTILDPSKLTAPTTAKPETPKEAPPDKANGLPHPAPQGTKAAKLTCEDVYGVVARALKLDDTDAALRSAYATLESEGKVLRDLSTTVVKAANEARKQLESPIACEPLVTAAKNYLSVSDPDAALQAAKKHEKAIKDLDDKRATEAAYLVVAQSQMEEGGCTSKQASDRLAVAQKNVDKAATAIAAERTFATENAKSLETLKAAREEVKAVLGSPGRFTRVLTTGNFDVPTVVKVTVDARPAGKKDAAAISLETRTIRFGGRQRFALAAGVAVGFLDTVHYEAQQGYVLDANGSVVLDTAGQPTVGRVVAETEDSHYRAGPLLALHTRIGGSCSTCDVTNHVTLGLTTNLLGDTSGVEYLLGYSLGLAEERLFLTFGGYSARTEELQPGFHVGSAIPDSIPEAPIRKDRHWGIGFATSWRFK